MIYVAIVMVIIGGIFLGIGLSDFDEGLMVVGVLLLLVFGITCFTKASELSEKVTKYEYIMLQKGIATTTTEGGIEIK